MSKKIALITGANKGLGFETALQLGREGVHIIAAARDKTKGIEAVEKLKEAGIDAEFLQLDVDKDTDIRFAYEYILNKYGKLDILINNAGIQIESDNWGVNTSIGLEESILRKTMDTNFFSLVKLTDTLLPLIRKSEAGRIVNLSSILGSLQLHSNPASPIYASKLFAYNTSKTALNAYTIHLSAALANTAIKVNAVHPGWVKTDMGTDAAPMHIPEGAKTSVALALAGADGVSGKFIHLDQEIPW
ncbi:MAG: SDR family oxidoreductase [Bacteroidota bacterium]|nr:SDR family oxidoreductase [Bacteroidota bacterium]